MLLLLLLLVLQRGVNPLLVFVEENIVCGCDTCVVDICFDSPLSVPVVLLSSVSHRCCGVVHNRAVVVATAAVIHHPRDSHHVRLYVVVTVIRSSSFSPRGESLRNTLLCLDPLGLRGS